MNPSHADWARHLRHLAGAETHTDASGFADDLGHTRPVDTPFFAWRAARAGHGPDARAAWDDSPDVLLWAALTDPAVDPASVLSGPHAERETRQRFDDGALFSQRAGKVPLEVWTEQELSAAHALSWLVTQQRHSGLAGTLDDVARWHVRSLQPDNATNHPWAVHLFIDRSITLDDETDRGAARLYAETLLHNCQVSMGRPDAFSAQILLDSADWLDAAGAV